MNQILDIILKDTFTLTQLKSRVRTVKTNLLKNFFGGEHNLQPAVQELNWLSTLPPIFNAQFNKDNVYKIFEDIERKVQQLPTLTIYITFEPSIDAIYQIGTFARKTFGPSFLLDIKLDPNLIAGAALVWKGMYRDYSLRAKLEQKKGEILENFKKYMR